MVTVNCENDFCTMQSYDYAAKITKIRRSNTINLKFNFKIINADYRFRHGGIDFNFFFFLIKFLKDFQKRKDERKNLIFGKDFQI